jgi:hypothetical protein
MLRLVTTDVGRGPCHNPYPRKSIPHVQSHVSGSDTWILICIAFDGDRVIS